jgi:hypothetical protein
MVDGSFPRPVVRHGGVRFEHVQLHELSVSGSVHHNLYA